MMNKISGVLVTLFMLTSCMLSAQSNVVIADQFVKALAEHRYADAAGFFDPEISQVNKDILKGGWEQINAGFGKYQSHYMTKADKDARSVIVGIVFEKKPQGFSCNFNDHHQLVGFILAALPDTSRSEAAQLPVPSRFKEELISVAVTGGTIKGTLMLPENNSVPMRVALIIAGSGATDRNGNAQIQLKTNAYKMLAEALAEKGIASLRYDKRLVGESNDFVPDESVLRFEDYVQDAVKLCQYLNEDRKASKLYIIGHSEGGLIGMLAAQQVKTDAYVSLCGAGENIAATLQRQIPGEPAHSIIEQLKEGNRTNNVPSDFQIVFRPSVQPYLISWMKYEPENEIQKLKIPVLIVGGTTDIQVPVADAQNLKKALPGAELVLIEGMNHILKDAPAEPNANKITYTQQNLPLNKELVKDLTRFLAEK